MTVTWEELHWDDFTQWFLFIALWELVMKNSRNRRILRSTFSRLMCYHWVYTHLFPSLSEKEYWRKQLIERKAKGEDQRSFQKLALTFSCCIIARIKKYACGDVKKNGPWDMTMDCMRTLLQNCWDENMKTEWGLVNLECGSQSQIELVFFSFSANLVPLQKWNSDERIAFGLRKHSIFFSSYAFYSLNF